MPIFIFYCDREIDGGGRPVHIKFSEQITLMSATDPKQTWSNVLQWRPAALPKHQFQGKVGLEARVIHVTAWRAKSRSGKSCMPTLPIKPKLKCYRGLKEKLHRKIENHNRIAYRVTNHINKLIANNPDEMQEYLFDVLVADLSLTTDEVHAAIMEGDGITVRDEGITVRVTNEDRRALAPYVGIKSAPAKR
jgi:hypothetical protein